MLPHQHATTFISPVWSGVRGKRKFTLQPEMIIHKHDLKWPYRCQHKKPMWLAYNPQTQHWKWMRINFKGPILWNTHCLWSLHIQAGPHWACQLPEWGKTGDSCMVSAAHPLVTRRIYRLFRFCSFRYVTKGASVLCQLQNNRGDSGCV